MTLIDKIGAPDSVNVNASAKDAEVTRLKEKIGRVSSTNFEFVHEPYQKR